MLLLEKVLVHHTRSNLAWHLHNVVHVRTTEHSSWSGLAWSHRTDLDISAGLLELLLLLFGSLSLLLLHLLFFALLSLLLQFLLDFVDLFR